jgi:hypothetical protein
VLSLSLRKMLRRRSAFEISRRDHGLASQVVPGGSCTTQPRPTKCGPLAPAVWTITTIAFIVHLHPCPRWLSSEALCTRVNMSCGNSMGK